MKDSQDTLTVQGLAKTKYRTQALVIMLLCAAFLFYKYILQNFPSIITNELMQTFHLTGAGLGNLAATFFYSFIIMQFLAGILLDKWGARYLTSIAILLCGLGTIAFSYCDKELSAGIMRATTGVGVAFATVAYMKLASTWCDVKYYALVAGLLVTAAMVGAVFGQAPLSFFMHTYGWRMSLLSLGVFGVILSILFFCIVRNSPADKVEVKHQFPQVKWSEIRAVLLDKRNWMLTLYAGLGFSPLVIVGGLWGNPFLQEAYQLTPTQSSALISLSFIGLGIGSPFFGFISNRVDDRSLLMMGGTFCALLCFLPIIYGHNLASWLIGSLLFGFGFFLGVFMLAFTLGKEINNIAVTATVISMINASDTILDAITDPLIGRILDGLSEGAMQNGVHYFSVENYRYALTILPLYLVAAIVCMMFFKKFSKNT